jgi:hypothetical protein
MLFSALEKTTLSRTLLDYGSSIFKESNNDTVSYLTNATNQLHDDFSVEYRHEGAPLDPDETFFLKRILQRSVLDAD